MTSRIPVRFKVDLQFLTENKPLQHLEPKKNACQLASRPTFRLHLFHFFFRSHPRSEVKKRQWESQRKRKTFQSCRDCLMRPEMWDEVFAWCYRSRITGVIRVEAIIYSWLWWSTVMVMSIMTFPNAGLFALAGRVKLSNLFMIFSVH